MDLKELQKHIRRLATLEESSDIVISCYLALQNGRVVNGEAFSKRLRLLRASVALEQLQGFDEAVDHIGEYLGSELSTESVGIAVFARGGVEPFFLPLQFQVPVPDWIMGGPCPNIFHLVELKDTYHRFVILISTEEWARILEVNLGEITQELWRERPELQQRVKQGWSKEKYLRHRRHHSEKFFKEKIDVLEKLMAQGGHKHFLLAGSPRLTGQIRSLLPKHLSEKLIDTVSTSSGDKIPDIVRTAIEMFVEEEENDSRAVLDTLLDEFHGNGLGVAGISSTIRALHQGRVDVLVIAKGFEVETGWRCRHCQYIGENYQTTESCAECGLKDLEATELKEEMIRLAERTGCRVEVVNYDDRLIEFQGVGALLRFNTQEEYGSRRAAVQ